MQSPPSSHSNYTKAGEPFPPWQIKIVMPCLRTNFREESQTVHNSPLHYSDPTLNPAYLSTPLFPQNFIFQAPLSTKFTSECIVDNITLFKHFLCIIYAKACNNLFFLFYFQTMYIANSFLLKFAHECNIEDKTLLKHTKGHVASWYNLKKCFLFFFIYDLY